MTVGCLGALPPHSVLKAVCEAVPGEAFEWVEIAPDAFPRARSLRGLLVSDPYRRAIMPRLDWISEAARQIGAVNTVVNREGRLCGYNTERHGFSALLRRTGLDLSGKNVLVLGSGEAAKTALYTARTLGAARVDQALRRGDVEIIINADSRGMPVPTEAFKNLAGVIDMNCEPLRSRLVLSARAAGIPAEGGLYMLAAQAARSAELIRDTRFPEGLTDEIYERILRRTENVVLIGMPGSGKSTVARLLGQRLGRPVAGVDERVARRAGMAIPEIFARFGEAGFRRLESEVIAEIAKTGGQIVATGGGSILREENVEALRQNGRLYLLDRPLEQLTPTPDRPLGDTREKVRRLYLERAPLYRAAADEIISTAATAEETALSLEKRVT